MCAHIHIHRGLRAQFSSIQMSIHSKNILRCFFQGIWARNVGSKVRQKGSKAKQQCITLVLYAKYRHKGFTSDAYLAKSDALAQY